MKEITIDNEKVFLKKSRSGYRVIHPIKINGKINWKNLIAGGDWLNLLKIAIIVIIISGCLKEYVTAVRVANECLSNQFILNPIR